MYGSLTFSKLSFIEKVLAFAKEVKEAQSNTNTEDYVILEQGLSKGID